MANERTTAEFVGYIKGNERLELSVYDDGGEPAIGYGHRLLPGEDFNAGITEAQADALLLSDLKKASLAAARTVKRTHPGTEFSGLSRNQQFKLTEFGMNIGPSFQKEFPLWTSAVVRGDVEAEKAQYLRHRSDGEPMTTRNEAYADFYFGSDRDAGSRGTNEQASEQSVSRRKPDGGGSEGGVGESQPLTIDQIVGAEGFGALSPEQRVERLADESEKFRSFLDQDPERARAFASRWSDQAAASERAEEDPDLLSSIRGGARVGIATFAWTMANAAMLIEKLGVENDYDESWRKFANLQFIDGGNMIGSDWYDIVASVVAGIPGGLIIPGLATVAAGYALPAVVTAGTATALAPVVGFGLTGAVSAADQGVAAAAKRGFIDAALGAIYPATAHLSRVRRMALESGAAFAVSEQEDGTRRGIESLAMGIVAGGNKARGPYAIMKKLGVVDQFEQAALGRAAIKRTQQQNMDTVTALEMPLVDTYGNPIDSLLSAMHTQMDMVAGEHPMTSRPMDRAPHEVAKIASRFDDSTTDKRVVGRDAIDESRYSSEFQPGHEWIDNRPFTVLEENAVRVIKKYKKAGEVITPLAEAFEVPVHPGLGSDPKLRDTLGWYAYARGTPDGKIVNPQRLHSRDRPNVQTVAHEIGHHFGYKYKTLRRLHDLREREVVEDLARIDEITAEHGVGPETTGNAEGVLGETRFSGVETDASGKATVSGIFKLHKDGKIPEDLRYIPEQLSASYDRNNLPEGLSEIMRYWLTNNRKFGGEVSLETKFPNVMKTIETWKAELPRKQRKAIERFQKDAHEHLSQNGAAAIGSVMGVDQNASEVLSTRGMMARQMFIDDTSGFMNLVQKTFGFQPPESVLETFRLLRGSAEAGARMVNWGAPVFIRDVNGGRMIRYMGKSLNEIFEPYPSGAKIDRFMEYSTARQAKANKLQFRDFEHGGIVRELAEVSPRKRAEIRERNQTRERLFSDEMIEDGMSLAKDHPEYLKTFSELEAFASKMADFGQEAGLWNKDQRAAWKRGSFIFSFFREMESSGRKGVPTASLLTGETPTHTMTGSTRNLRDPFSNLLETHMRTMRLGLENIAKQELLKFVQHAEGGGRFGEILKPKPNMKEFSLDDIREAALTELRKRHPNADPQVLETMLSRTFPNTGDIEKLAMFLGNTTPHGENVMTVFVNGKPKYFAVQDPLLKMSLLAMRRPQVVGVEKFMNNMRRVKQYFVTIAPGFIAANFARDVAMASIMSKTGNFHLGKALKGMWGAIREDQDFRDYHANGGGSAGLRADPIQTRARVIAHAQRKGFDPKRMILDGLSVVKALDYIGRTVEISSRLGEYKAARKQGARARHAAYLGREVSTDFNMRGENSAMRFMGHSIPFFNAMIAGGDRLYRGVRYDPSHKMATGAKIATVAFLSGGLYLLNRQIDEYNGLQDWDKWGYWHFYLPKWSDDGEREKNQDGEYAGQLAYLHLKMPKLWEVGSIGTLWERFLQSLLEDDDTDLALDVVHIIGQNAGLNLFDRGFPLPIPAGLDIIAEQYSNRILYTGNPIESAAMSNVDAWARKRARSPRVYGKWGELMEHVPGPDIMKSPARAEALLRGVFGEFATIGAHLADSIFFPGGPTVPLDRRPILSRFYEGYGKYSKQESEFYERLHSFKQASNTMRWMATQPDQIDRIGEWANDPAKMGQIGLALQFDQMQQTLSMLSEYQDQIASGITGATPDEMAREIRELTQQKRMLMGQLNEVAKMIEKGK